MPRFPSIDFAPGWVLVIFFLSLCEAIGLTIYFQAHLTDPEFASMQAAYLEAQGADAMMAVGPECGAAHLKGAKDNCRQEAHHAFQARQPERQDLDIRHIKGRQAHPAPSPHHG